MSHEALLGIGMVGLMVIFGFLTLFLFVYVIYDLVRNQDQMQGAEKVVWLLIVLIFQPLLGLIVYLTVVKLADTTILEEADLKQEKTRIDELERLTKLHKEGSLTDDEFKEEKRRILEDYDR